MESTFNSGIFITVRTVNGILPNGSCEHLPDSSFRCLRWIGSTDQGTKILYGIVLFQNGGDNGPPGHKLHQFSKERPFFVYRIKFLGVPIAQLRIFHSHDPKTGRRNFFQNSTNMPVLHSIRLYHDKCSVCTHLSKFSAKVHFIPATCNSW